MGFAEPGATSAFSDKKDNGSFKVIPDLAFRWVIGLSEAREHLVHVFYYIACELPGCAQSFELLEWFSHFLDALLLLQVFHYQLEHAQ